MTSLILNRNWFARSLIGALLLSAVLLVPMFVVSAIGSGGLENTLISFYVSVILVVGLQLFSGNSGIISFGHLSFAGIGAYVSSLLTLSPPLKMTLGLSLPSSVAEAEMSLVPALVIAGAVAAVIALLTGSIILRLNGTAAVIAIFALLLIANVIFNGWTAVTHGAGGLYGIPKETTVGIAFICAALAVFVGRIYRGSRLGLTLRASRESEVAASSIGVPVRRHRALAWVISAVICSIGGALMAHQLTSFSPTSFFLAPTFVIVVMLVVGGMGTVSGAVLGAIIVTLIQEVLRNFEGGGISLGPIEIERLTGLTQTALVVMILAVLYTSREGILSRREADEILWRRLSRKSNNEKGSRDPV